MRLTKASLLATAKARYDADVAAIERVFALEVGPGIQLVGRPRIREMILAALTAAGGTLAAKEIAAVTPAKYQSIIPELRRMVRDGVLVKPRHGVFAMPSTSANVTTRVWINEPATPEVEAAFKACSPVPAAPRPESVVAP